MAQGSGGFRARIREGFSDNASGWGKLPLTFGTIPTWESVGSEIGKCGPFRPAVGAAAGGERGKSRESPLLPQRESGRELQALSTVFRRLRG